MQIQSNMFGSAQVQSSNLLSSDGRKVNIKPNLAVEAADPISTAKPSKGLENSSTSPSPVNMDDVNTEFNTPEYQQITSEQLTSRLDAKLEYEQALKGSDSAVGQYLANEHAAAREEIQQMVGIDTYA